MPDLLSLAPAAGLPDLSLVPGIAPVAALLADGLGVLSLLSAAPWGAYLNGSPVVVADTVMEMGRDKGYNISDYPIEQGSFASYNKVEQPFEVSIRFATGGSATGRQALISSVEAVLGDLNLYDVVTPDAVYPNANFVREEYRRTASDGGNSLLMIDVRMQEVRLVSGQATGQNTQDPASADQQNGGTVQGQAAPSAATSSVQAGTASETAASGATAVGAGYTGAPLPPERPATLQPSSPIGQGGIGHA